IASKMSDNSASAGNAISSFDQLRQECELTVQSVCDSLANRLPADCDLAKMQSAVLADFTEFLANITAGESVEAGCAKLDQANARPLPDGRLAWRPPLDLPGPDRPRAICRDATYADLLAYHDWLRQHCASLLNECRDLRANLRAELAQADANVIELEAQAEVLSCLAGSADQFNLDPRLLPE
ncbi:hypothetical protein BOX15_Mlig005633g1, partial [Macrostomum lignano]